MIIEYHAIQSFAPANLNRDDAGAPKSCTFGGVRRARVSSQSWKRAMRMKFQADQNGLDTGVRTKRAHQAIVNRLLKRDPSLGKKRARHRAAVVLEAEPLALGLAPGDEKEASVEIKTKQLIFFRKEDLDALAEVADDFGSEIDKLDPSLGAVGQSDEETKSARSGGNKGKSDKKLVLPKEAAERIKTAMEASGRTVDVALFGRMLAELPRANVDAACQVAHAIGTHRLAAEHDFYTAVDDRKPADNEGADMIGVIEYNASCLYRYAVLDLKQLGENLGSTISSEELLGIVGRFTSAFALSVPSGKQNTFAAHNPPTCLLMTARESGTWNLANAFVEPVNGQGSGGGLAAKSVRRLCEQLRKVDEMFGAGDAPVRGRVLSEETDLDWGPTIDRVENIRDLAGWDLGA